MAWRRSPAEPLRLVKASFGSGAAASDALQVQFEGIFPLLIIKWYSWLLAFSLPPGVSGALLCCSRSLRQNTPSAPSQFYIHSFSFLLTPTLLRGPRIAEAVIFEWRAE